MMVLDHPLDVQLSDSTSRRVKDWCNHTRVWNNLRILRIGIDNEFFYG